MNFSSAAQAQMAGQIVRCDVLAEFQFLSETIRLWNGFGPLPTLDGKVWEGVAGMGDISGLSQSYNGSAPPLTLSISGVDARFAAKAKAESEEYFNRPIVVFLQFFTEDWQPLDNPYGLTMARMTNLTSQMKTAPDGKSKTYTVSITAETPFAVRRRPPFGYFTDRDQKLRYPGDNGLSRVAGIDNRVIRFPDW